MEDFGLYLVITDPVAGYEKCAEDAVRAGVGIIQLRMKKTCRDEFLATARKLREITAGTKTLFIVNDDASIAAEVGADGVHVGQGDMSVAEVRRLYPQLRIVGLSTHSIENAEAAILQKPDYIGVGPVYPTPTKEDADPALGVELACKIANSVPFPAVLIGGIDTDTLPLIIKGGAKNWSCVRAVCAQKDPYEAILNFNRIAEEAVRANKNC